MLHEFLVVFRDRCRLGTETVRGGLGAGKIFQIPAGRERTKNFNPRRTLVLTIFIEVPPSMHIKRTRPGDISTGIEVNRQVQRGHRPDQSDRSGQLIVEYIFLLSWPIC